MGSDTGMKISIGQKVVVRIAEAVPVTGGLELELLSVDGASLPRGPRMGRKKVTSRRANRSKSKNDKVRKKVKRRRK